MGLFKKKQPKTCDFGEHSGKPFSIPPVKPIGVPRGIKCSVAECTNYATTEIGDEYLCKKCAKKR